MRRELHRGNNPVGVIFFDRSNIATLGLRRKSVSVCFALASIDTFLSNLRPLTYDLRPILEQELHTQLDAAGVLGR